MIAATKEYQLTCKDCGCEFVHARMVDPDHEFVVGGECNFPIRCPGCKGKSKVERKIRRGHYRDPTVEQTCEGCGKHFMGRKRKYCTPKCRVPKQYDHECMVCGSQFISTQPLGSVCSDKCQHKRHKQWQRERAQSVLESLGGTSDNCFTMSMSSVTGTTSEVLFDLWAMKKGYIVARLIAANAAGVDRVMWDGNCWCGVQVKTTHNHAGQFRLRPEDVLNPSVCPILAVVNPSTGDVTVFDSDVILRGKKRV